jgi:hypothetical protein
VWAGLFPDLRNAEELTSESLRRVAPATREPEEVDVGRA